MKILVDADRLHEVIMKAVDIKHQFENNSKLYEMASYITGNLSSMWFSGTQEVEQASIRATQGLSDSLNDTMKRLEEAANNWKPNYEEGCIRLEESLHKQAIQEELKNKYIIVEILDMLIRDEERKTTGLGSGVSTLLQSDAEDLKVKLVGEE